LRWTTTKSACLSQPGNRLPTVLPPLPGIALANTNVGSEEVSQMASSVDHGAVREMEVVWPSGTGLRKQVPNHHEGRWLKTVL
jgi:hypothetical protein